MMYKYTRDAETPTLHRLQWTYNFNELDTKPSLVLKVLDAR